MLTRRMFRGRMFRERMFRGRMFREKIVVYLFPLAWLLLAGLFNFLAILDVTIIIHAYKKASFLPVSIYSRGRMKKYCIYKCTRRRKCN
jgi:uncharacterized membrane protein